MNFLSDFFDFFLPRLCPSCGNKLNSVENNICPTCFNNIESAKENRIIKEYNKKFRAAGIISGFTSLYVFEKDKEIQKIIHAIKYENRFKTGESLGKILGERIINENKGWNIDLIIPVPLHHLKRVERGYNQSYYISRGVSKILNLKHDNRSVKRIKYTETQTSMNIIERVENISGAFDVKKNNIITTKTILLIDDVITTGSTVTECARALLENGAAKVYAASLSIAD